MSEDKNISPDWIAVDWGTTNLRAWAVSKSGRALDMACSSDGMGGLERDQFETVLRKSIACWNLGGSTTVVACGMVGSRQGWIEAPYTKAPCKPLPDGLIKAPVNGDDLSVYIVPGIRQDNPSDVMRGEETQIAGFIATNPDWDGVICLPGSHTKWVHISAGEVVSFQTFMTGEMFDTLSQNTVLRHSIANEGWDDDAFIDAVSDSMSKPERIAGRLFSLRADGLLAGQSAQVARARLSGLLVGAELAAARPYWLGQQIAILGDEKLAKIYSAALLEQGVSAMRTDADHMTVAGLNAAYQSLKETA
ncbi:2-keto-3-deoxy-galactonokinase [Amylibacter kogurei]|uniref:2-keto-3-deoxy-galactonokinase n=1 Tax=Paramylibacter kogurei TaxID=1889778 RepID=A0A2G5KBK9_9RHOB|nr:2-dehydro-3-deoxygalactonokinase [Amylibacter kogurei]PIB26014.1 2-keto-3-deoxy-galactonokinase [Amylibacter kogurei]